MLSCAPFWLMLGVLCLLAAALLFAKPAAAQYGGAGPAAAPTPPAPQPGSQPPGSQQPPPSQQPPSQQPPSQQPPSQLPASQQPALQQPPLQEQSAAGRSGKSAVDPTLLQGRYDVEELRRLIEIARESGFTDAQVREITVEDENGTVIKAWEFLQAYDKRKAAEEARLAAERAKVYLAPQDVQHELDGTQTKDLRTLRDTMLFVE